MVLRSCYNLMGSGSPATGRLSRRSANRVCGIDYASREGKGLAGSDPLFRLASWLLKVQVSSTAGALPASPRSCQLGGHDASGWRGVVWIERGGSAVI